MFRKVGFYKTSENKKKFEEIKFNILQNLKMYLINPVFFGNEKKIF